MAVFTAFLKRFPRDRELVVEALSSLSQVREWAVLASGPVLCVVGDAPDPRQAMENLQRSVAQGDSSGENGIELFMQDQAVYEFFEFGLGIRQGRPGDSREMKRILGDLDQFLDTGKNPLVLRLRAELADLWERTKREGYFQGGTEQTEVCIELIRKIFGKSSSVRLVLLGEAQHAANWVSAIDQLGPAFFWIGDRIPNESDGDEPDVSTGLARKLDELDSPPNAFIFLPGADRGQAEHLLNWSLEELRGEPIFVADLRPESECPRLERLPENVFAFTAGDLRAICKDNLAANRKSVGKLESLIREQAAAVLEWRQKHTPSRIEGIIGRSAGLQRILDVLPRIAATDITVLLEGESGTGKELIARAIHRLSKRARNPFVVVNAGAIPETLLESELFGHVRGAFTGAHTEKKGLFEEADGGTLFLDEIGEMSPALQVKLLRALQEREIRRVGGNRVRKIDVRLIAATDRDLQRLVREGRFRQDLYYRLNVMRLRIPPLRERPEDIPVLAEHFLRKANQKLGKHVREISPQVMSLLLRYRWPGNVRELENAIEHAVVLAVGHSILPEDLPQEICSEPVPSASTASDEHWPTLDEVERQHIVETLERFGWNLALVTRKLGISRATLWRKMKTYGLQPPKSADRGSGQEN